MFQRHTSTSRADITGIVQNPSPRESSCGQAIQTGLEERIPVLEILKIQESSRGMSHHSAAVLTVSHSDTTGA